MTAMKQEQICPMIKQVNLFLSQDPDTIGWIVNTACLQPLNNLIQVRNALVSSMSEIL